MTTAIASWLKHLPRLSSHIIRGLRPERTRRKVFFLKRAVALAILLVLGVIGLVLAPASIVARGVLWLLFRERRTPATVGQLDYSPDAAITGLAPSTQAHQPGTTT